MLAFDYTEEDFYGELSNTWIHGWTREHVITGKFKFLSCNVVNDDLIIPIFSIPAQMGNGAAYDIGYIDQKLRENISSETLTSHFLIGVSTAKRLCTC